MPDFIDSEPIGNAGYGFSADPASASITAPSAPEPQGWGDLASDVGKSFIGASERQIGNFYNLAGSGATDPEQRQAFQSSGQSYLKSGQDWTSSVSPAGQDISNADIFSRETLEHPFAKAAMGVAKQGLWNAALIPGAGAVSMVARGVIGGALGISEAYGQLTDSINSIPDDQLQKLNPSYAEARKTQPEFDARQGLINQAWDNISSGGKLLAAGTGALATEAGPLAAIGHTVSGMGGKTLASLVANRPAQMAIGAAEAGGIQGAQYLGTAIPTRSGLASIGAPTDTVSDVAWGTAEAAGMGAVIGGAARGLRRPPIPGENVTGVTTSKMPPRDEYDGTSAWGKLNMVPEGQPDPAEAAALGSQLPAPKPMLALPPPSNQNRPALPAPPEPPGPHWPPPDVIHAGPPIPPRPAGFDAPRPGELPFTYPEPNLPRQAELPLAPPGPPERPAPVQGELPLQAPQQPVTQLGLPGMGADVVHAPGETIARPAEEAPKPAPVKAPVTKVSEPAPTPLSQEETAAIETRAKAVIDEHPALAGEDTSNITQRKAIQKQATATINGFGADDRLAIASQLEDGHPLVDYLQTANDLAEQKVPTAKKVNAFVDADTELREHLGIAKPAEEPTTEPTKEKAPTQKVPDIQQKMKEEIARQEKEPPVTKVSEPTEELPAPKKGAYILPSKPIKEQPAKTQAAIDKAAAVEAKRQAAIQKLTGKKETPVQAPERPIVPGKTEPKITIVPPSDVRLQPITPGEKAKAIAAKFPMKGEEPIPTQKKPPAAPIKEFNKLKAALEAKAGEEPAQAKSKIAQAIKGILPEPDYEASRRPPKAQQAIEKARSIEEAKKQVDPNPTEAQRAANNFQQGHPPTSETQGQKVTITSPAGEEGRAQGRILGTADNIPGEHLPVVIHSNEDTGVVHVFNSIDPKTSRFEGHVAVTGAKDAQEAARSYKAALVEKLAEQTGQPTHEILDELQGKNTFAGVVDMTPEQFEHWKETRNPEEPVHPSTEGKHPFDEVETSAGKIKALGSYTVKIALEDLLNKLEYTPGTRIFRQLAEQAIKYIPDVPVYDILGRDMKKVIPGGAEGAYSAQRNHILLGDTSDHPGVTLLHEIYHAATIHLYNNNAAFRGKVNKLLQEYKQGLSSLRGEDAIMPYDIKIGGGREFLAEIANPVLQRQLAQMQMSDKLANDLGMSAWRRATRTLWNGVVKSFMDGLKELGITVPGKDSPSKFSLLEGLLKLTDEGFMARSKLARNDFGNMYRSMAREHEAEMATRDAQHNTQQNIRDTMHDAATKPEKVQDFYARTGKTISTKVSDFLDGLSEDAKFEGRKLFTNFISSDAIRQSYWGKFGAKNENNPHLRAQEAGFKRDATLDHRQRGTDFSLQDMYDEYNKHNKADIEHMADTLGQATAYGINPEHKIGEGDNEWMAKPGWAWRSQAKQAIANYPRIAKMYKDVHPDLKPRFDKLRDDYRKAAFENANVAVNEVIDSLTNAGRKYLEPLKVANDPMAKDRQEYINFHNDWEKNWDKNKDILRQHLLDGEVTDDEKRWLSERGFKDTSDINKLARPRGLFVPLDHAGDIIINARTKIEPPTNGELVKGTDNVFEFKNEKDAEAFLDKQPPKSNMSVVHFNEEGEIVPKWEIKQDPDTGKVTWSADNRRYRVEVNDKYYSAHDSMSEATKRYKQLQASGQFTKVSEPQSKRSGWYSGLSVSSPLFNHLMSEVDKRTDYTSAQKEAVKNLLKETALSSLEGNRISKHLLERKAVAGWDTDYIKTYKNYFYAHNALMSRAEHAKELNAALNDMIKYAKEHEFDEGAKDRSYILTELNNRDHFFGTPNYLGDTTAENKTAGAMLKTLRAISFLDKMVSPAHLISHQTHQFLTFDMGAAKYGGYQAMGMGSRLHGALSGAGFKNLLKAGNRSLRILFAKETRGLNYTDNLIRNVLDAFPKYSKDLQALYDQAFATNRLHPDQGFDSSILHMGSGTASRMMARLDLASRQTMASAEAYNRIWGHSLLYLLAREAGEGHEQAMRFSFDSVSRTQGLLSRSNMSALMSKWYMKSPTQFRGWGFNMMATLAHNVYQLFKPDTKEARAEAVRRLTWLLGSTMALTGVNGLPSDPIRIGFVLAGMLGLTNYNYSDVQNAMREKIAKVTGSPGLANFFMNGILGSLGPFSLYGADRMGFGSLAVYGEPNTYSAPDISKWFLDLMGGAPYTGVTQVGAGIQAIKDGDYAKAIETFVPIKLLDDATKAYKGAYEGVPTKTGVPGMSPYSPGEAFMQAFGFPPLRRQLYGQARQEEYRAEQRISQEHTDLLNALGTARTGPDIHKAQMQIAAYNLRNPQARISPQDMAKAMRRQYAPSEMGYTITKGKQQRLQDLQQSYGF